MIAIAASISVTVLTMLALLFGALAPHARDDEEERRYNTVCLICLGTMLVIIVVGGVGAWLI